MYEFLGPTSTMALLLGPLTHQCVCIHQIYIYIGISVYMCMHVCMYACIHTYIYTYRRMDMDIQTCCSMLPAFWEPTQKGPARSGGRPARRTGAGPPVASGFGPLSRRGAAGDLGLGSRVALIYIYIYICIYTPTYMYIYIYAINRQIYIHIYIYVYLIPSS